MHMTRLLMLPFLALAELFVFALCCCLALARQFKQAQRLMNWAQHTFPSRRWYFPDGHSHE